MARFLDSQPLDTGDLFPALSCELVGGGRLELPAGFTRPFTAVLVNRGSWCPYCTKQLLAFQAALPKLMEAGLGVISLSVDPRDKAEAMVEQRGLTFPVGYGADVAKLARTLGAFYDDRPAHTAPYVHATGFVVGPNNIIVTAVYSSGAIGRLEWQDVLGLVQYLRAH